MKHYGASLTGANNVVDGGEASVLTIGDASTHNDKIVIHNQNTASGSTDAAIASTTGLVIAPTAAGRGATHVLGADGREVAITSLVSENSAHDYNATNNFIPVLQLTGTGVSAVPHFIDSTIESEVTAGSVTRSAAPTAEITVQLAVTTGDTVLELTSASSGAANTAGIGVGNKFIISSGSAFPANPETEIVYEITSVGTGSGGNRRYRFNPPVDASDNGLGILFFVDQTNAGGATTIHGDVTINAIGATGGNLTVDGDLTVSGTTTTINTATLDVEDQYITAANTAAGSTKAVTEGGLFVEHTSTATTKTFAGIRYGDGATAGTFQWEVCTDANADDGSDGTWSALGVTGANPVTSVSGGAGIEASPTTGAVVVTAAVTAVGIANGDTTAGGGLRLTNGSGAASTDNAATLGIAPGGITAGQLAADPAGTRAPLANGTDGQVLSSDGNGGFTWESAGGSRTTLAFSKAAANTLIRINRNTDAGRDGVNANHGLPAASTSNIYKIDVYETVTPANGNGVAQHMILPESIIVYTGTEPAAALPSQAANAQTVDAAAGDIVIELGATTAVLAGHVVITSN